MTIFGHNGPKNSRLEKGGPKNILQNLLVFILQVSSRSEGFGCISLAHLHICTIFQSVLD